MAVLIHHAALSISRPQSPRKRKRRAARLFTGTVGLVIPILMLSYFPGLKSLRIATLEMMSRPRSHFD